MRRFTAVDMGNGDCTCKLYGHYGKHGTMVVDKISFIEKEVKKEVAIDYKEEWKVLQHIYGKYTIQDRRGIPSIPSTLDELMNFQIQRTIMARENLMEKFVKEKLTTNIDGGTENSYNVDIIFRGGLCGRTSVHKEEFKNWMKNRKEEK